MKLSKKQRGVLRGMAPGALAAVAIISLGAYSNPFDYTEDLTLSQRLSVAIRAGALLAACLAVHLLIAPKDSNFSW